MDQIFMKDEGYTPGIDKLAGSTNGENIYKDKIVFELHLRNENHEKKELKEINCSKYLNHDRFIDLAQFEKDQTYLPDQYRQPVMKDLIMSLADLTVKIKVKNSNKIMKLDSPQSKHCIVLEGTGKVDDVFPYGQDDDDEYCPCDECKDLESPKKEWGAIRILTSDKLLISDEDIKNTQCLLFYDEENTSNIEILTGVRIVMLDKERGICKFVCISHNMDLIRKLDNMVDAFVGNWKKAFKQFKNIKSCEDRLAIIVSHPHGCKKHITFGQWEKQYNEDNRFKGFKYDTPTCPGSTGSFILMPNFDDSDDINIFPYF